MRANEFINEKKIANPTQRQCNVGHSKLSNVRYSQCVSLGLRAHNSDHNVGTGKQGVKGSGVPLRGKSLKSELHGGSVKYYAKK
jgi:hypothetical protein